MMGFRTEARRNFLQALEKKGFIVLIPNQSRGIRLISRDPIEREARLEELRQRAEQRTTVRATIGPFKP